MKLIAVWILCAAAGCGLTTMKVAPVKVEPIQMTIDVNVHDDAATAAPSGLPGGSKRH
jgi:hypothetical protein